MMHAIHTNDRKGDRGPVQIARAALTAGFATVALVALAWSMAPAQAQAGSGACSRTSYLQFQACLNEVDDDWYIARAICTNESDREEAWECFRESSPGSRYAEHSHCREQFRARERLCDAVGQAPYDPDFDPDLFDETFTVTNPYVPLTVGNIWEYETEDETNTVEVLNETKLIEGVTCVVVNDLVIGEDTMEDTDDWYAQRNNGDVDYCGEESKDFELFEGDNPVLPELIENEGSFKAGRDGDKSGTLFPGTPVVGLTYRQEWSASNAEDHATILSISYGYGNDPELDEFVPEELAELLCSNDDCVVTRDGTPIEPRSVERKYLAPGIGVFLEVDPRSGEINQLVGCNFADVCDDLPEYEGDDDDDD
jgi:hypothetical protein